MPRLREMIILLVATMTVCAAFKLPEQHRWETRLRADELRWSGIVM